MVDKSKLSSNTIRTVLIVICVILSFVMYMQRRTRNNLKQAAKLPFYNVQPAQVPDGTYHGKVYTSFMHVQVDVSVQDGRFTKIEIVENQGAYGQKIAPLINEMIAQNNTVVPAIKGDEIGSIVFIACVDDALFNGLPDEQKNQLSEKVR